MTGAKDLHVAPIASAEAHKFVRANHYSGKTVNNSQLHLGAFIGRRLVGVAQFGPPMLRERLIGLVSGTAWNDMLELNRFVLVDDTPRNSESRFLAVCMRLIRRQYPHVGWVVSFADATQCGDGTIYRAAGFVLTGFKKNVEIWGAPDNGEQRGAGDVMMKFTVKKRAGGAASMRRYRGAGWKPLEGFQLRYVYFLDPTARQRLTVPILPFSRIAEIGAGMYKGEPRVGSIDSDAPAVLAGEGGAIPTPTLHPGEKDG